MIWLSLLREILSNMCIVIGCDVINYEINLTLLIKTFFLRGQKVKTKFKYLGNEESF